MVCKYSVHDPQILLFLSLSISVSLCLSVSVSLSFSVSVSVLAQSDGSSSVVVAGYNVSAPAGSRVVLQCVSGRMVWTRDRLRDRQRVVHWDLYRAGPDYAMERVADMFSAGDQRIYNSYNQGRVSLSQSAFKNGNFSLVIRGERVNVRAVTTLSCCLQCTVLDKLVLTVCVCLCV